MKSKLLIFLALLVAAVIGWKFLLGPKKVEDVRATVEKGDITLTTTISGKVKTVKEASLSFPLSGKLIQVASESSEVNEGDVLAQSDAFDLYSVYQVAVANLNKSRSTYSNAVEAKAEIDATYAGREGDNIVRAKLAEGKTSVEAAASAVEAAKYSVDQTLAGLSKAVIRAPFSGTVTKTSYKIGEVPAMSAEVIHLADLTSFYFEAEADEVDIGNLKLGTSSLIKLDAFPGQEFKGVIFAIDSISHTTSSGGTAYNVKIKIDGKPNLILRSGLNGEADITREVKRGVLTIPSPLVYEREGKNFVHTFRNDGKEEEREVSLGEFVDGRYEITSGLREGEIVIRKAQK